jgi:hypothetical protein
MSVGCGRLLRGDAPEVASSASTTSEKTASFEPKYV